MTKYQIINQLLKIKRPYGETVQLNLIKWGNNSPKYDIRKWGSDNQPQKGLTLEKDELDAIYLQLKKLYGEEIEKDKKLNNVSQEINISSKESAEGDINNNGNIFEDTNDNKNFNRIGVIPDEELPFGSPFVTSDIKPKYTIAKKKKNNRLQYTDYLIYTNSFDADHYNHNSEKVKIIIEELDSVCAIRENTLEAVYCETCQKYYITEYKYQEEKRDKKIILCSLFSEKEYEDYVMCQNYLREKALMRAMGYDVVNRTRNQRWTLIDHMIRTKARTRGQIKYHLEFLIDFGTKSKKYNAVEKWSEDMKYLKDNYY